MGKLSWISLLMIILLASCSKSNNSIQKTNADSTVYREKYIMAGKIDVEKKADLTTQVSAKVLTARKDVGDAVQQGETLITLDRKEIEAQIASLKKNLTNAQTDLNRTKDLAKNGYESQVQLDAVEYRVKSAENALEQATLQMQKGVLSAPISGYISAKNINEGEIAAPGMVLYSIVNTKNMHVNAYIPETMLNQIQTNMKVVIKAREVQDKVFSGTIKMIDPVVDAKSRSALVKIELDKLDSSLKPGMNVLVGIAGSGE